MPDGQPLIFALKRLDLALDLAAGLTEVLDDGANVYLYGLGRIGEQQPAGWAYHLPDALGSVRQLASANGGVRLAQSFKPYGSLLSSAGSGATPYGFTGEWTDVTGLVHLRARYMDPYLNQFVQPDTILPDFTNPQDLNRYSYARNNPLKLTDPSGHCAEYGDDACWTMYDRIVQLCPECRVHAAPPGTTLDQYGYDYQKDVFDLVRSGWRPDKPAESQDTHDLTAPESNGLTFHQGVALWHFVETTPIAVWSSAMGWEIIGMGSMAAAGTAAVPVVGPPLAVVVEGSVIFIGVS